MGFLLPFVAFLAFLVTSQDLECSISTYDIDWSGGYSNYESDMPDFTWSHVNVGECNSDSFCAAADLEGEFTVSTKILGWDVSVSKSFDVEHEFCASELTCNLFGDGVEGNCVSSQYKFEYWQPMSCDESKNFNELIINYDLNTRFLCCNNDDCNADLPFDQLNCPENNDLSNYLTALTDCWNNVKKDWQKDLYCNDDNYAINYYKTCCLYGDCAKESHRKKDRCTYYATCTTTLESILADFGECACQAATDNNYDGAIINELMGTHWEDFCPNAVIQCESNGDLSLKKYLYYAKYIYYIDIDPDLSDYYAKLVNNHLKNETGQDPTVEPNPTTVKPGTTVGPVRRRRLLFSNDENEEMPSAKGESFHTLPSISSDLKILDKKTNTDLGDATKKTTQVGYLVTLEYQTQRDMNYMIGWLDENGDNIVFDATGIQPDPSYTASERKEKDITEEAQGKSNALRINSSIISGVIVMMMVMMIL